MKLWKSRPSQRQPAGPSPEMPEPPEGLEWWVDTDSGPWRRTVVYLFPRGLERLPRNSLGDVEIYTGEWSRAEMWRYLRDEDSGSLDAIVRAAEAMLADLRDKRAQYRTREAANAMLSETLGCKVDSRG